jgi:energy-coupling factor transporter transmembrane protein EcfT
MGFWNNYPITNQALWNTILAIAFLILGIIFLFTDNMLPFGVILLFVFGSFINNYSAQESILELFIDPVIFILAIIGLLLSWLNTDNLTAQQKEYQKMLNDFEKDYQNKEIPPYTNRIYDIKKSGLENKKKLIDKLNNKK